MIAFGVIYAFVSAIIATAALMDHKSRFHRSITIKRFADAWMFWLLCPTLIFMSMMAYLANQFDDWIEDEAAVERKA